MGSTQQTSGVFGRRPSGGDLGATLIVAAAMTVWVLWLTGSGLTGWSVRMVAGLVLALGYLGCMTTRSRIAQVYGAQGNDRSPVPYMVAASLLGAVALLSGLAALIWAGEAMLAVLTATIVALWAITTARHLAAPREPAPGKG